MLDPSNPLRLFCFHSFNLPLNISNAQCPQVGRHLFVHSGSSGSHCYQIHGQIRGAKNHVSIPSLKLTTRPWKLMVGRVPQTNFSGASLVSFREGIFQHVQTERPKISQFGMSFRNRNGPLEHQEQMLEEIGKMQGPGGVDHSAPNLEVMDIICHMIHMYISIYIYGYMIISRNLWI